MEIAKQLYPPHVAFLHHFDRTKTAEESTRVVVLSILNDVPERKIDPVEITMPSPNLMSGGSNKHGVGGSFSTRENRPRLWKPILVKDEDSQQ